MQGAYNYDRELEIRAQIGSHMIPVYPIRSASETFYQLEKALGIHSSPFHSVSMSFEQYINNHFIVGLDCEKVLDAGFTGINTKSGQILTLSIKPANGVLDAMTTAMPNLLHVTLHSDNVLEIRAVGCTVFD
jgi:hypothetical protein